MEMKLSDYVAAAERGEAVQFQTVPCHAWYDRQPTMAWYPCYAYRLKPAPLECWANIYDIHTIPTVYYHASKAKALLVASALPPIRRAVHMREVV